MRLLRLAIENRRWDLAAHTIVLATARLLNNVAQGESTGRGDKPHATRTRIKWYVSLALFSTVKAAALIGVTD